MRPLERAAWACAVAAFAALLLHLPGPLTLLPGIAAAVQGIVERPRWASAPTWVAAAAAPIAWGAGARDLAPVAFVGAAAALLALAAALPAIAPVFVLPKPTGPHAIGRTTREWVDRDRVDAFDPSRPRELVVDVWYPAASTSSRPAPYVPDAAIFGPLLALVGLPRFLLGQLALVATHAAEGAPAEPGRFPVVLFLSGRGGYRQSNTALVEELASHGYAVVAVDSPHTACGVAFADGRRVPLDPRMFDPENPGHGAFLDEVLPFLADDVRFALDRLAELDRGDGMLGGRVDLDRVGIAGVSLGGIVAARACVGEPRLRACLVLDAFVPADAVGAIDAPAMWITRDAATMRREGWREADVVETCETIRAAVERHPGDAYLVRIPGVYHADFTDAPRFSPLTRAAGITGALPAARVHAILAAYARALFDRHLRGRSAPRLDGPSDAFPEVELAPRRGGPTPVRG